MANGDAECARSFHGTGDFALHSRAAVLEVTLHTLYLSVNKQKELICHFSYMKVEIVIKCIINQTAAARP
jgi:hypothetical protein